MRHHSETSANLPGAADALARVPFNRGSVAGRGPAEDGFWIAERAEDEVSRLITISGVESEGGRPFSTGLRDPMRNLHARRSRALCANAVSTCGCWMRRRSGRSSWSPLPMPSRHCGRDRC